MALRLSGPSPSRLSHRDYCNSRRDGHCDKAATIVTGSGPVASCPMRRFLPDAARRWLLARCGAAVASCWWLRCHLSSNVLRTDSEGWRESKFRKCRARCGESGTNVDKCGELALIVEKVT